MELLYCKVILKHYLMGEASQYLIISLSFSDILTMLVLDEGVCIMNLKRLEAVWESWASGSLSGSLKMRKSFIRVGGVEKNILYVVILLGSGSVHKTVFPESVGSCV